MTRIGGNREGHEEREGQKEPTPRGVFSWREAGKEKRDVEFKTSDRAAWISAVSRAGCVCPSLAIRCWLPGGALCLHSTTRQPGANLLPKTCELRRCPAHRDQVWSPG